MRRYGGAVSFVWERGGVTIFARKFALSLRAGMRNVGRCIEVAGARHAQKVGLRREAKLRKKVLSGIEIYS